MNKLEEFLQRLRGSPVSHERGLGEMFPSDRIEEIKKRELRRFEEAQDKKWKNWLESVSK